MQDPVEKLEDYYNGLMTIVEKSVTSEEEGILLAGAMMAVAKILYYKNLSEDQADDIMNHNARDLINLLKPTIH
tara:strand:+ start:1150 stop:1371 length:222 start_codon:yes stop_codon:yes gene_type:complete